MGQADVSQYADYISVTSKNVCTLSWSIVVPLLKTNIHKLNTIDSFTLKFYWNSIFQLTFGECDTH